MRVGSSPSTHLVLLHGSDVAVLDVAGVAAELLAALATAALASTGAGRGSSLGGLGGGRGGLGGGDEDGRGGRLGGGGSLSGSRGLGVASDGSLCGTGSGGSGGDSGSRGRLGRGGAGAGTTGRLGSTTGKGLGGAGNGRGALRNSGGTRNHLGARDGVGAELSVDVEEDTLIVGLVQLGTQGTLGLLSTGTSDLEVEALGVVLGTVLLATGVEGDDLVSENVEAGLDVLGDLDHPAVAVGDELVGGVLAGGGGAVDQTLLADLEELEGLLVDGLAAAGAAGGEVVEDGALVGLGPGVPLEEDAVTGGDTGVTLGVLGILVADDVGGSEGLGADEAVVGGSVGPTDDNRRVAAVGQGEDVVTGVGGAVDDNVVDVAVGSNANGTGEGREDGLLGEGRHCEELSVFGKLR